MSRARSFAVVAVACVLALVVVSCTNDDKPTSAKDKDAASTTTLPPGVVTTTTPEQAESILLTSTDGYLLAADTADSSHIQFISVTAPSNPDDPASPSVDVAVHDQPCFLKGSDGTGDTNGRFAMPVEPGPGTGTTPTWGIFQLTGTDVGSFAVSFVTTLGTPSYQGDTGRPYGCASLSDGRLATTDLGVDGTPTGRLTMWFGPFEKGTTPTACTVDPALVDPRGVFVDEQDRVLVASSGAPTAGVWRYGRLPTSADANGGCGGTDPLGAPLADKVRKEPFIAAGDHGLTGPSGIAGSIDNGIFVSSAISGVIDEYDANGQHRATVLAPQAGEQLDASTTFFAGTPLGMAIDVDGTLYYADPGWVLDRTGHATAPANAGLIQGLDLNTASARPEVFLDSLNDLTNVTIFVPSGGNEGSPL